MDHASALAVEEDVGVGRGVHARAVVLERHVADECLRIRGSVQREPRRRRLPHVDAMERGRQCCLRYRGAREQPRESRGVGPGNDHRSRPPQFRHERRLRVGVEPRERAAHRHEVRADDEERLVEAHARGISPELAVDLEVRVAFGHEQLELPRFAVVPRQRHRVGVWRRADPRARQPGNLRQQFLRECAGQDEGCGPPEAEINRHGETVIVVAGAADEQGQPPPVDACRKRDVINRQVDGLCLRRASTFDAPLVHHGDDRARLVDR